MSTGTANGGSQKRTLNSFLQNLGEKYDDLLNNPQSDPVKYKKILAYLAKELKPKRTNGYICNCEFPTIAAHVFNYMKEDTKTIIYPIVILSLPSVMFPTNTTCHCYQHWYMSPKTVFIIMCHSDYICPFPLKWFPQGIDISLLPDIGTENSKMWVTKYTQKIQKIDGINYSPLKGKPNMYLYNALLVKNHFFNIKNITVEEFEFLYNAGVKHIGIYLYSIRDMLSVNRNILYGLPQSYGNKPLPHNATKINETSFCTVEQAERAFKFLEFLAKRVDLRLYETMPDDFSLPIYLTNVWCGKYSNKVSAMSLSHIAAAGFTEERFLSICNSSFNHWTPEKHNCKILYSQFFRRQVNCLLLVQKRHTKMYGYMSFLTKDVLMIIIKWLAYYDWQGYNQIVYHNDNYALYMNNHKAWLDARFRLKIPPYNIARNHATIEEMVLIETGRMQPKSQELLLNEFVNNIAEFERPHSKTYQHIRVWNNVFKYYGLTGYSLNGINDIDECNDVIRDACREIVIMLLERDGEVTSDFITKAKRATKPIQKKKIKDTKKRERDAEPR